MNDGKLTDVIIEEERYEDPRTGVLKPCQSLTVWADPEMKDIIKGVPGVSEVFNSHADTKYAVYLDPRYDLEWVKAEIEARIKIGGEA